MILWAIAHRRPECAPCGIALPCLPAQPEESVMTLRPVRIGGEPLFEFRLCDCSFVAGQTGGVLARPCIAVLPRKCQCALKVLARIMSGVVSGLG